jgi:hypothetical protein
MKLFQNSGMSLGYKTYFESIARGETTFSERLMVFLNDRYSACHFLKPVLHRESSTFFTNGDDSKLQRAWAVEHGMPRSTDLGSILLAQVEQHRTDVFYNLDPMRFGSDFVRKLPASVKVKICWRAAPSPGADFSAYDLVLCNFPSIIASWRSKGLRAEYFAPAHDSRMDDFADQQERPVDLVFVGSYTRHHVHRARILEGAAALASRYRVIFCLDRSRLTRLADSPLGMIPFLRHYRRPNMIRRVSVKPVFGVELYKLLASSKIVLNGAIDMAGSDRGNMRCFEAMGCGSLLISDAGTYPPGFESGENMSTYETPDDAVQLISSTLDNWEARKELALRGRAMIRDRYSKDEQWKAFQRLVHIS